MSAERGRIKDAMSEQQVASREVMVALDEITTVTSSVSDFAAETETGSREIKNEMNNNIYLRNDICKFINFGYNDNASIDGWTHFDLKELPDKINQFLTAQQVFATLSSKL
jgi:hypothetical protein